VGSASHPGRLLPPGKTRYPLYRRLSGPQGRSAQVRKISPPPGFDPRTIKFVASRYTDCATGPTLICIRSSSKFLSSNLAIIVEKQFKGLYMLHEYTFPLKSATHINLHVKDMTLLYSDWPVQYYLLQ